MNFDTRFRDDSDETVYLHHVDQKAGTVRVQVLGCGLTKTFLHDVSKRADAKHTALQKKTSGFLAAVTASRKRVVLAWAESGHGMGGRGDSLVAGDAVLGNAPWASRAIKLAKILDLDLSSPFDKPETPEGSFQASHVEVKLATFAATLLLQLRMQAGGRTAYRSLSRKNLAELRGSRWSGGDVLRFEIHVSRKHCTRCGAFLKKLQELTGVRFDIKPGTRVVPIEYHQQQLIAATELGLGAGGSKPHATTALETYEENGVIHYITPRDGLGKLGLARSSALTRLSLHHLSNVDKPLPATPVIDAPDFVDLSDSEDVDAGTASEQLRDGFPFPPVKSRSMGRRSI